MSATDNTNKAAATRKSRRFSNEMWMMIVAASILLAFAIYAALNWFVLVEEVALVNAKGEAVTNPYLVLERLAVAAGASVQRSNKSAELDHHLSSSVAMKSAVLMLGDRRLAEMRPTRVAEIVAWVRAGGHLIVEAEQPSLDDPILANWGVDRKKLVWRNGKYTELDRRKSIDDQAPAIEEANNSEQTSSDEFTLDTELTPDRRPPKGESSRGARGIPFLPAPQQHPSDITMADGMSFRMHFRPYQNLYLSADSPALTGDIVSDKYGKRLLDFMDGNGRVTVISNFDFMIYRNLREHDHAELIWHLLSNSGATKPRLLLSVYRQGDGLWQWLADHARMIIVSALSLLLLCLWRIVPRFGAPLPAVMDVRRDFSGHVVASGVFMMNRHAWTSLITTMRNRFLHVLKQQHPRTSQMTDSQRIAYLAAQLNASEDDVARALHVQVASRRETIAVIRQLREMLRRISHKRAFNQFSSKQ